MLTRELFEKEVDSAELNSKQLFDIVNQHLKTNVCDLSISLKDLIEYAQIRFELGELPKVIYYCYYGLTQNPSNDEKNTLLSIIISSLDKLMNNSIDSTDTNRKNTINNSNNSRNKIIDLIKSTKIDSITLTSYSARKQSTMPKVSHNEYDQIFEAYNSKLQQGDYQSAFNEIYFLFSDTYLKESIIDDQNILTEFHSFCNNWKDKNKSKKA